MVDIVNEAYKLLEEMGYDDIHVCYEKKRLRFGDGGYLAKYIGKLTGKKHPNRIWIYGNEPSLVRVGLGYLIIHELTHHEFRKKYGYDKKVDEDFDPRFKELEREYLEKFWEVCRDEHG